MPETAPNDVPPPADDEAPPEDDDGWNVVSIPQATTFGDSDAVDSAPTVLNSYVSPAPATPVPENNRYGESVVREILNATFISEETVEPPRAAPSGMGA